LDFPLASCFSSFFFHSRQPLSLSPPFPTRRSSDLDVGSFSCSLLRRVHRSILEHVCRRLAEAVPAADVGQRRARDRLSKPPAYRSEEHTSELQSRVDLVCRLLLEKKKDQIAISEAM